MMDICNVPSMFWTLLFLFSFTVLFLTPSLCSSTPQLSHGRHPHLGNASDQQALLGFLSAITYDPWQSLSTTWKPNVSFCKWRGVICSPRRHRVVSLNVSSLGLQDDEDLALTSTRTLKGSTGYIAPEYGLGGHVTTKGDVYSYGIVLLEMLTRKKPTDNMFVEGVNLQKWVDSSVPKRVGEVVDRSLLRRNSAIIEYEKDLNCLGQLIKVGLLCAKESPKERPTMIGIVGTLQSIKETFLGARGIPKLQSDISHLLCSTSTTHINIGEGQSSSSLL